MTALKPTTIASGFVPLTFGRTIRSSAARVPFKTALTCEGRAMTYQVLVKRMNQVANMAISMGLRSRDVVALVAPNCLEYIEIVAGLTDVGITVATLNPQLAPNELRDTFGDCCPRAVIVHPDCADRVSESLPGDTQMIILGEAYEELLARASDSFNPPLLDESHPFIIGYTSGTSGQPKGVILSHRSRTLTILAMAAEYGCYGPEETFLLLTPLYHGAGFVFAAANLAYGGTCLIMPRFDAAAVMARLGSEPITGVFVVPTLLKRLHELGEKEFAVGRRNSLKAIISNASALSPALKEQTVEAFGEGLLFESYGSTEGGIVANMRPADLLRKPESVGLPFFATEIELRDDNGNLVGDGEPGELFSRSPFLFNGYHNRPQETAETLRDGWVGVGDLAIRDSEGFYSIVGRKKDMIISGGVNIYPSEIEKVIGALPNVAEVAVVGLPDREWGERVHAYVVRGGGGGVTEDEIFATCRTALAGYKQPRGITFIEELPRNSGGKILKRQLRDEALGGAV